MLTVLTSLRRALRSERGIALPAMMSLMLVLGILTAGVIVTVATAPKGVHLALVEVEPEAPARGKDTA